MSLVSFWCMGMCKTKIYCYEKYNHRRFYVRCSTDSLYKR